MTTTINASTSSGLVQTADTSGVLALQTANTTAMTISAAQYVGVANTAAPVLGYEKFGVTGSVGISTTGSTALGLWNTANTGLMQFYSTGGGTSAGSVSASGAALTIAGGSDLNLTATGANVMTFNTNSTERMRITAAGNVTMTGSLTTSQTAGIVGTTTNNNASAGAVGEYIESLSGFFTNSTTVTNATSISLTAGDWDVFVALSSGGASATCTGASIGISTTSATLGTQAQDFINFAADGVNGNCGGSFSKRISVASTTTIYAPTRITAGTCTYTIVLLSARRRR
jgi:hypothetical protein